MSDTTKDLSYFLTLLYPCEVIPSEAGGFVAHHPDLVGCAAEGHDVAEALKNLSEARQLWLRAKWEDDDSIPEPSSAEPSGRLMLRVPIRLHAALDRLAAMYEKSLNRLLNEVLFSYANALPASHGFGSPAAMVSEGSTGVRYAYRLTPLPTGDFVAEHPDLPGCFSAGGDAAEALTNLDEAREIWIQGRKEENIPVPEPLSAKHTGLIHLRIPPALHADLVRDAQRNGTTLNQGLVCCLAEASLELNNLAFSTSLREKLRRELQELRINFEHSLLIDLKPEYAAFLLGLLCVKKTEFVEAEVLFSRAIRGDFVLEEFREYFDLVKTFLSPQHALPLAHCLRRGRESKESEALMSELVEALRTT